VDLTGSPGAAQEARMTRPVFRFAPSPTGYLHLGHAYSALLNAKAAAETGGRFLLRIEDTDTTRCMPAFTQAIFEDLAWLGLRWEEPARIQSQHTDEYRAAIARLAAMGLVYRCICSRQDIARNAGAGRDPEDQPLYPGTCKGKEVEAGPYALRLDMAKAAAIAGKLDWHEEGEGLVRGDPLAWGDVVIGRKDTGASYHMAVVHDDALQGVTTVIRGRDLFHATSIHRLLQALLGLPTPRYRHHPLLTDETGRRLAKSHGSPTLRGLRAEGHSPEAIRKLLDNGAIQKSLAMPLTSQSP
jgi:glutamyl-Q tRNA(Asp) synthetase